MYPYFHNGSFLYCLSAKALFSIAKGCAARRGDQFAGSRGCRYNTSVSSTTLGGSCFP